MQVSSIDIHEQVQHSVTNEHTTIVVKCKKVNIASTNGNMFTHIYEIDFSKTRGVYDFEDNDFSLEMSGQTIKQFLKALMLEPSLREIILDHVKDNP